MTLPKVLLSLNWLVAYNGLYSARAGRRLTEHDDNGVDTR